MHRRTVIATAGSVLTSMGVGCLTTGERNTVAAGTWPQVAYDSRNTRYTPDARGPRDDATVAWRALGDQQVFPPVVDDDLYLTERGGSVFALASTDATEQWSTELQRVDVAPALSDGRVFVISRTEENIVRLHAFDAETGSSEWVREEGITASPSTVFPVGPTIRDGVIYIASERGVLACNGETGTPEWTATLGEHMVETDDGPTWRTDWATPAVTTDRVFTFDRNDSHQATREVYAVDRATGDREWTAELTVEDGWYLRGYVVAGNDRVFVPAVKPYAQGFEDNPAAVGDGRLLALERGTGDVVWSREFPDASLRPPAYADGTVYVSAWNVVEEAWSVHALAADDGSRHWRHEPSDPASVPTVAGDTVYIGQRESVAAITTAAGEQRWELNVGAAVDSIVVVEDTAYVQTFRGSSDGNQLLAIKEP